MHRALLSHLSGKKLSCAPVPGLGEISLAETRGHFIFGHKLTSQKKSRKMGPSLAGDGFGPFLRRLREQRGLPLREIAAAAGMDQAHLSKIELGQRLPTASQTAALARFFQQDLVELEAHRIAEKFRRKHLGSPAAARAVLILHGGHGLETGRSKAATRAVPPPSVENEPAGDSGVIILHAD